MFAVILLKEARLEFMNRMDVFAETVTIILKNPFLDVHVVTELQDIVAETAIHKNKSVESN
jgi:hypothetical protein